MRAAPEDAHEVRAGGGLDVGGMDDDAVLGRHQVETEHHRAHGCARCGGESRGIS